MADRAAPRDGGPLPPLIGFGRDLRARGLPVGTGRILTFVRAVAALGFTDRDALYWAGRASMVARRDDLEAYDEAFEQWYRSLRVTDELGIELQLPTPPPEGEDGFDPGYEPDDLEVRVEAAAEWHGADDDDEVADGDESSIRIVASGAEVLRSKSFAELTDEERARVATLIRPLRLQVPVERTRRTRPASKGAALRRAPHVAALAAHAGRAVRSRVARAHGATPPARVDPRHQRIDGAVLAGADAVRVRGDGRRPPGRGVRLRHAAHARHAHAAHEGPRPRAARDRPPGRGLGRRHPHRRVAQVAARRVEPAGGAARGRRRALLATGSSAATPSCCGRRWRACAGSPTGWSGSTR